MSKGMATVIGDTFKIQIFFKRKRRTGRTLEFQFQSTLGYVHYYIYTLYRTLYWIMYIIIFYERQDEVRTK